MPNIRYNPNNTEGNHPTSIDIIDAEVKKDDRIVATDITDLYDVSISDNIQTGDGLYYNMSTMMWETGNIISGEGGCNHIKNQDIYIDYTQTENGDGTKDNPFNSFHNFFIYANTCNRLDDYLTLKIDGPNVLEEDVNEYLDCQGSHQIDIDMGTITIPITYEISQSRYYELDESDFSYTRFTLKHTKNIRSITVDITIEDRGTFDGDVEDFEWNEFFKVSCGGAHSVLLHKDKTIWVTGDNSNGQLGFEPEPGESDQTFGYIKVPTYLGNDLLFDDISCGFYHTVGVGIDGSLWGTGRNDRYQLGIYGDKSKFTKTGNYEYIWKKVACGYNFTVALDKDGVLWGAGDNSYGQLSLGGVYYSKNFIKLDVSKNNAPSDGWKYIACGYYATYAIDKYDRLWVCGYNGQGELGTKDNTSKSYFTLVDYLPDIKYVAAGAHHAAVVSYDRKIYTTGDNYYGQLGLGDNTDRNTFTFFGGGTVNDNDDYLNINVDKVACGGYHTIYYERTNTHRLKMRAAGMNSQGQLGDGTTTNSNRFKYVGGELYLSYGIMYNGFELPIWLDCGDRSTVTNYATFDNNSNAINHIYSCGSNTSGQIGMPDQTTYNTFIKPFGDEPLIVNGNYVSPEKFYVYNYDIAVFNIINSNVRLNIKGSNNIKRKICYGSSSKYFIYNLNFIPVKVTDKSYVKIDGPINGLSVEGSYVEVSGNNFTPDWTIQNNAIIYANYWTGSTFVYNSRWMISEYEMIDTIYDVGFYYKEPPIY